MLQEPLQPKYSQRFFAGKPSAALAAVQDHDDPAEATDNKALNSSAVTQVMHGRAWIGGERDALENNALEGSLL